MVIKYLMNLNMEEPDIPILSVFNFQEAKMDTQYAVMDDDKCNMHILDRLLLEKKETKTKNRVKKSLEPGQLVGHWNPLERKKYHWFIQMHHGHFQNKQLRRMDKIFKSMATFIGTRAADQCRSHHQKMQKKYKTFHNIIFNLRLAHYKTAQVGDMIEDFSSYGITSFNHLIDSFQLNQSIVQQKTEFTDTKQKEGFENNIHYNFFGDREFDLEEHAFAAMTL